MLLIILLLLSVLTNVLLILLLLRSGQQNTAEDQTDEIARIVRDEVEAETEVLADQRRMGTCWVKYEYRQSCFHITCR